MSRTARHAKKTRMTWNRSRGKEKRESLFFYLPIPYFTCSSIASVILFIHPLLTQCVCVTTIIKCTKNKQRKTKEQKSYWKDQESKESHTPTPPPTPPKKKKQPQEPKNKTETEKEQ